MDQAFLWTAAILCVLYGALTAYAVLVQLRVRKIQAGAALGLLLFGLLVAASGVLALLRWDRVLWLLGIGLLGIHALAINNGLKMFGKLNPAHHLVRLAVSTVLFLLTWLGLK